MTVYNIKYSLGNRVLIAAVCAKTPQEAQDIFLDRYEFHTVKPVLISYVAMV